MTGNTAKLKDARLTEKQRIALRMDLSGATDSQIAQALGIRRDNANKLVRRAREQFENIRRRLAAIPGIETLLQTK